MPSEEQVSEEWSLRGREKEESYDWLGAAVDYGKSVKTYLATKNYLQAGQAQEHIGLCCYRAAFQAESPNEFQKRIRTASDAYHKAANIFAKIGEHQGEGGRCSCKAKGQYVRLWIEEGMSTRKRLLRYCQRLAEEALEIYEAARDKQGFSKACNDIVVYLDERLRIESGKDVIQRLLEKADDYREKAMEASSAIGNECEVAKAYYNAGHHFYVTVFLRPLTEKTEETRQKALGYLQRAIELFEKTNQPFFSLLARLDFVRIAYSRITLEPKQGMKRFEQLYMESSRTKDNRLMGRLSFRMALHSWWLIRLERDPEKKRQWYQRCVEYSERAIDRGRLVSDDCGIAFACWLLAYSKQAFAEELETQPSNRRLLLGESVDNSRRSVKYAERSGVLEAVHFAKHSLFISLLFYSEVERDENKKRIALEEAIKRGEGCIKAAKSGMPFDLWNLGINYCFLAVALARQAELEFDQKRQEYLRKKASSHWDEGKNSTLKYLALYPDAKRYWALGGLSLIYGQSLDRLYSLTLREDILNEIIRVYTESASMFSQVGLSSLVGQAQWQIARTLDLQGKFSEAAVYFDSASGSFEEAASQTPLVKYWFMDHALYMLAWKEMEEAKLCSEEKNHSRSAEHYRKASNYLKETLKWRYLSPYYLALSQAETGQGLTKEGKVDEANRMLEEAAESFGQAEVLLKGRKTLAETSEETEEILKLTKIAKERREAYKTRTIFEAANIPKTLPDHPETAAGLNAFEDACIRARLVVPKYFAVGRETRIGLDVVNVGRKPALVVRVEKLAPSSLSVLEVSPDFSLEGESLNMEGKLVGPLQAFSLTVRVRPVVFDSVELGPRVVYVNYHGDFMVHNVEPVLMQPIITFESESVHLVFRFLVEAFKEDHVKKGRSIGKSGWRTRPQIIRGVERINKRHVYGGHGQLGPIIMRLINRGLIDVEVEKGKRSRGGRLTKIRIAHEKEAVKRYIQGNGFYLNRRLETVLRD